MLAEGAQVRTVTIPCGDVSLAADCVGDDRDRSVVLLHGGGQTRHSWRAAAFDLAKQGWFVVATDLRGHGDSDWSTDAQYHLDQFANDVTGIARYLGRPPVLVGASLGGSASLAALGRDPTLALGLVLVDVSPFIQMSGTNRIIEFMASRPDGFGSLQEAADAVVAYLPHRAQRDLEGLQKNLRNVGGRLFWHWDPGLLASAEKVVQRNAFVDPARLGAAAASLKIPTLLIRGGKSDVVSIEDAKRFLDVVPHAECCTVEGAHHMVAGDDNKVFGVVIAEFLERRIRPRLELNRRTVQ